MMEVLVRGQAVVQRDCFVSFRLLEWIAEVLERSLPWQVGVVPMEGPAAEEMEVVPVIIANVEQAQTPVKGHPSISLHPLSSPILPYSPLPHMYFPHTSVPSPGTTLKGRQLSHSQSDDFPEVDPLNVVDFPCPPLLLPQQHQTSLGCIGTGPRDTTAPSAITWTPIYGRLGTRRLGTVVLCISFVD
jgi:hypothetical protein